MYTVDERDAVKPLPDVPQSGVGAPLPTVLADENRVMLAYLVHRHDPAWDGTYVTVVGADADGMEIAIVDFAHPLLHMFGPPNNEAFQGHPLANRGLRPYSAAEVIESSWLRAVERMNAVHPNHDPARFMANRRHFIFAFHDSTFECIAEGFAITRFQGSMSGAVQKMAASH